MMFRMALGGVLTTPCLAAMSAYIYQLDVLWFYGDDGLLACARVLLSALLRAPVQMQRFVAYATCHQPFVGLQDEGKSGAGAIQWQPLGCLWCGRPMPSCSMVITRLML
jgi:hypothetical protein